MHTFRYQKAAFGVEVLAKTIKAQIILLVITRIYPNYHPYFGIWLNKVVLNCFHESQRAEISATKSMKSLMHMSTITQDDAYKNKQKLVD